jgi:hypothetical protein
MYESHAADAEVCRKGGSRIQTFCRLIPEDTNPLSELWWLRKPWRYAVRSSAEKASEACRKVPICACTLSVNEM